ncbi:MAG: energy transducer TonB [Steroidobacteraceae bacterium]|nr:energy transducer TonB [Steroidobacteraceae bacterium]
MSVADPIRSTDVTVKDRLTVTLFLAGLFHLIVILGITFAAPARDSSAVPTLEVLLTRSTLPETAANERASYLAERTQQGAGDPRTERTRQPRAGTAAEDQPGDARGAPEQASAEELRGGDPRLLSRRDAEPRFTAEGELAQPLLPELPRELRAGVLSPFAGADDADDVELKGAARRELLVTPSTRQSEVATYLDAWKRRIEQVGTVHFPNEARRRHLSGNPVIEVVLADSGGLIRAGVLHSSGHAELDRAALEILKLAAPFEAFPAELGQRHDVLRFAYEWQFVDGRLAGSAIEAPAP